ncbi:MAG: hypothetical protein L0271_21675 [Gemmatimonadetes bacterium]|nr:hypothetical protein [Gemmatimonadota bacterium]
MEPRDRAIESHAARTGSSALLLDEERGPRVRDLLGCLLARATTADFAVRRVRLASLDFRDDELRVRRCRVLLGMLDVDALTEAASAGRADESRAAALGALRRLIEDGRLEIRSAGTTRWSPDFAVLEGLDESGPLGSRTAALVGWLGLDGGGMAGPLLTAVIAGGPAVASTAARFERLWREAWDVLDVIASALQVVPRHTIAHGRPAGVAGESDSDG